jgi:hypothetical protein
MHTHAKPDRGFPFWDEFLVAVARRQKLFLATPAVTLAIFLLALYFGGKELKSVLDFLTFR